MSGSPIIQKGKLVGAVTHVFLNDPPKGCAIFIDNMLDMAAYPPIGGFLFMPYVKGVNNKITYKH